MPERSGHCIRGVKSRESIVRSAHEKERQSDEPGARKPAWYGEVKLPMKV